MRLAHLDLIRFGKFTDQQLDFPKAEVDLHVITGINEAGKSTLKEAIVDLFYGIPVNTSYGFLHQMSDLVIGGTLEQDGKSITIQRLKRRKNPLMGSDGEPLAEGSLLAWLGGTDRKFFERNFGLDHSTLVQGGKDILNSSGDAGAMLFQAAVGMSSLQKFLQKLESEADALWGDRKSGSRVYYAAYERFEAARSRLREFGVTANKWQVAKRALDQAKAAEDAATAAVREVATQRGRLERIRRVANAVAKMRAAEVERVAIGMPPVLPADAMDTLTSVESELAQTDVHKRVVQDALQRAQKSLEGVQRNPAVTARRQAVTALAGRVAEFLSANADLPKVEAQLEVRINDALSKVRDLGWPEKDISVVAAKVPSTLARKEIQALVKEAVDVKLRERQAKQACDDAAAKITELQAQIQGAPSLPATDELEMVLNAAVAVDFGITGPAAQQNLAGANADRDDAFLALAPWTGDDTALRSLQTPTPAEVQKHSVIKAGLLTRRDGLADSLGRKRADAARAKAEAEDAMRHVDSVTLDALQARRAQRDAVWQELRSGAKGLAEHGDLYEGEVHSADEVADRRYEKAASVEKAQQREESRRALDAEVKSLEEQLAGLDTEISELDTAWDRTITTINLPGMTPERFTGWLTRRDQALAAVDAAKAAARQLSALQIRAKVAMKSLSDALAHAGRGETEGESLANLILLARGVLKQNTGAIAADEARRKDLESLKRELPGRERTFQSAQQALEMWTERWKRQVAAAGLPADTELAGAEAALEIFNDLAMACSHIIDQRDNRIAAMTTCVKTFTEDARSLATQCLPQAAALEPVEISARLSATLSAAEAAEVEHARLMKEVEDAKKGLADAEQAAKVAQSRIVPLLSAAAAEGVQALRKAINASDAWRAAEDRRRTAEEEIRNGGDGLSVEHLCAEVDSTDLTQLEPRLTEATTLVDEAERRRTECIQTRTQAQTIYARIGGQDDAVKAESMRQDALLGMGDAVDEYVRIMVAARLLRWAIERYRDEKQGPLLAHASKLFSELTAGAFDKLSLNFETEPVSLTAHRLDTTKLTINGFSTGTESQLYLALRLAALELHLEDAAPLPFIGDDIFVHWSDDRAAAGFKALEHLARKTQVIVLTHHLHLADVAQRATGGKARVHAL